MPQPFTHSHAANQLTGTAPGQNVAQVTVTTFVFLLSSHITFTSLTGSGTAPSFFLLYQPHRVKAPLS